MVEVQTERKEQRSSISVAENIRFYSNLLASRIEREGTQAVYQDLSERYPIRTVVIPNVQGREKTISYLSSFDPQQAYDKQKPVVVWMTGATETPREYLYELYTLGATRDVIVPDFATISPQNTQAELSKLYQALHIEEPVHQIANSIGGPIAASYQQTNPHGVASIILNHTAPENSPVWAARYFYLLSALHASFAFIPWRVTLFGHGLMGKGRFLPQQTERENRTIMQLKQEAYKEHRVEAKEKGYKQFGQRYLDHVLTATTPSRRIQKYTPPVPSDIPALQIFTKDDPAVGKQDWSTYYPQVVSWQVPGVERTHFSPTQKSVTILERIGKFYDSLSS